MARLPAWQLLAAWLVAIALVPVARAQELEPRSYSPSPVGMNFAGLAYLHSSGGVATDATLPLQNVDASLDAAVATYARTFALGGRSASVAALLPYIDGEVTGDVMEERRSVDRAGFGDARLRLAVNLLGGPARSPAEFAARMPATTLGASVTVVAPSGEYQPDKLINLGSNRWAFRPEIGVYKPLGPWAFELAAGAWFFTDNRNFFGDTRRQQDPLVTAQLHMSYTFRPGFWLAASGTWYGGGETTVGGQANYDRQDNTRLGLTLSVPLAPGHSLKLGWADGVSTRTGSDFSTVTIGWQYAWF